MSLAISQPGSVVAGKVIRHIIPCNQDPIRKDVVVEHIKRPPFLWNSNAGRIKLYTAEQLGFQDKPVSHDYIVERLKNRGEVPLNACFIDYFWRYPGIVPEGWKDKYIEFMGTVYQVRGRKYCRTLCFKDGEPQKAVLDVTGHLLVSGLIAACAAR